MRGAIEIGDTVNTGTGFISQVIVTFALRWLLAAAVIGLALPLYALAVVPDQLAQDHLPAIIVIAVMGGLAGALLAGMLERLLARRSHSHEQDVTAEALQLRTTREQARAIFEMVTSISGTLDHYHVMEAAQSIGTLNLRENLGDDVRLISAVLLFQDDDSKLRVVTSRGLTPSDQNVRVAGQRGVLGLALKQAQPIFGGAAIHDPELRYFAAFQEAKSILAVPLGAGFDLYGAIVFGCEKANAFTDEHVELVSALGKQAALSLQNAVLYQNLLQEKEKIVEVEEDARKKLARDLHDGPTQSVATIAMRANFIRRLIERQPQQALEELWKIEDIARRTTKEIRHMLFTMRPLVLENKGLVAALEQLAEKMKETHNTIVLIRAAPDVETYLDTNAQGVLFYIVDEAVNNARKHAQSDQIWVRLSRRDNFVITEIEDHGKGFDLSEVDQDYDQRGSLGLVNMRERAGLIEGRLHIQSIKGKGTKITVLVPVDTTGVPGSSKPSSQPLKLQSQREVRKTSAPKPRRMSKPISTPRKSDASQRPITHLRPPRSPDAQGSKLRPASRPKPPPENSKPVDRRAPRPTPAGQDQPPDQKPASRPITKRLKPEEPPPEAPSKPSRPTRERDGSAPPSTGSSGEAS